MNLKTLFVLLCGYVLTCLLVSYTVQSAQHDWKSASLVCRDARDTHQIACVYMED